MAERNTNYLLHRDEVLERYGGKCANCGSSDDLEIHHIVPVALGGTDNVTNLAPLCHTCHQAAHRGRSIDDIKEHRKTAKRGGRGCKISFKKFDEAFEKYMTGRIGKKMFMALTGYGVTVTTNKNPNYQKSCEKRGIKENKNNIDIKGTSAPHRIWSLEDGEIVGYVEYLDGRREIMRYTETNENRVLYVPKGSNRLGGEHVIVSPNATKKTRSRVSKCDGQISLFDIPATT